VTLSPDRPAAAASADAGQRRWWTVSPEVLLDLDAAAPVSVALSVPKTGFRGWTG